VGKKSVEKLRFGGFVPKKVRPVVLSSLPNYLIGRRCGHKECGGPNLVPSIVLTDVGAKALPFCVDCKRYNR